MSDHSNIQDALRAAIGARKDSLKALRARIAELLEPIPIGATLRDDQGVVLRVVRVCTGASQWGNRTWDVTIKGIGYVDDLGKLVAETIDSDYWDGSNRHYRSTEPTVLGSRIDKDGLADYDEGEPIGIKLLPGKDTRALALRLPVAIARYMAECEAEAAANAATMQEAN